MLTILPEDFAAGQIQIEPWYPSMGHLQRHSKLMAKGLSNLYSQVVR